jgi:hypothetical protein
VLHADTETLAGETAARAILIADALDAGHAARDALTGAHIRLVAQLGLEQALLQLDHVGGIDLILVEAGDAADAVVENVLVRCNALADQLNAALVLTLDEAQLDLAVIQQLGGHSQLLCRPSAAERLSAVVLARARLRGRLRDSTADPDVARFERLHEEVARIAETLARLTRDARESATPTALREPVSGYRGPEDGPPEITAPEVRATIRARRMRSQFFPPDLFADPAWDMLLDLFAAALEGRRVSVSSLCIAAAVPPTTALRWIGALHESGLFERQADPTDRRRAYIALSAKGMDGMRLYAAAVKRAGLALA